MMNYLFPELSAEYYNFPWHTFVDLSVFIVRHQKFYFQKQEHNDQWDSATVPHLCIYCGFMPARVLEGGQSMSEV